VSNNINVRRTVGLVFVFAVCVVFICADLVVSSANILAQNSNSSMTDEMTRGGMMTSNSNSGSRKKGMRRRQKRRAKAAESDGAAMATGSASTRETSADPAVQADLSGTYIGKVNYPEGGMNGPATLEITGNEFTLTGEGSPVKGVVTAVTTRGYLGVTMMFGDRDPIPNTQSPPPLPAVSLRGKLVGGSLSLMSVEGEKREFSFTTTKPTVRAGIKPPT